jgi:WhiB family redox-sensing transcriptional regulator
MKKGRDMPQVVRPKAKRICDSCPVQQACLDYALANSIDVGTWGGLSVYERQELRRQQRAPTPV